MQAVVRALNILRELAPSKRGLTLHELHLHLDVPMGSLHRLLRVLQEEEFVTRSPTNLRYFLGPAARQLSHDHAARQMLLVDAHQAVVDAARLTGETVFLTELVGGRAVCTSLVEGKHPLRLFVRIGQEMPLNAAASARTLLAHQEEDVARAILGSYEMRTYTPVTPTGLAELMEHFSLIRARGYDVCDDELDDGVWAVSAPIFESTGGVCASVTLAAAGTRMADQQTRQTAKEIIVRAAGRMSAELGAPHASWEPAERASAPDPTARLTTGARVAPAAG